MRRSDEVSIKEFKIPGIVLMENAALGIIEEIKKDMLMKKLPSNGEASIVCGTGNNGGDGFAVARHLASMGWSVNVFICGDEKKIKDDALTNLAIIKKMNIPIFKIENTEAETFDKSLGRSHLIVDALLGTGFKGNLGGIYEFAVERINKHHKYVLSIDNPTGLNCDTGFAEGSCIKADKTVTLGLPKTGLVINDGPYYCGELSVCGLSIPEQVYDMVGIKRFITEKDDVGRLVKPRKLNGHKGTYGRILIVAGSIGMEGAGLLAAKAALRSGAGIVELAVPSRALEAVRGVIPVVITRGLSDDGEGCLAFNSGKEILTGSESASVLLLGPGLRNTHQVKEAVVYTLINCNKPIVLDADALNVISNEPEILIKRKEATIITPHPGEMARLMNISTNEVQQNRLEVAESFSQKYKVIVVLKGYRTIIASPWGETWINPTGNPGMATAGSGDVLGGVIAAFLAQGMSLMEAAVGGVYVHGAAGDKATKKYGQWGMVASDIIKYIPHTIMDIGGI